MGRERSGGDRGRDGDRSIESGGGVEDVRKAGGTGNGKRGYLIAKLVVCAEHRLCAQDRIADDSVNMEEQLRESAGEVRQETLGHRSKQALHIIWKILVMVFLQPRWPRQRSHPA